MRRGFHHVTRVLIFCPFLLFLCVGFVLLLLLFNGLRNFSEELFEALWKSFYQARDKEYSFPEEYSFSFINIEDSTGQNAFLTPNKSYYQGSVLWSTVTRCWHLLQHIFPSFLDSDSWHVYEVSILPPRTIIWGSRWIDTWRPRLPLSQKIAQEGREK